jgi:serine/threonine-protein kinase HipA
LKNFGVIYEDVTGPARLAPVYDLVSTPPYLPKDGMALTLNSSTDWQSAKRWFVLAKLDVIFPCR